MFDADFHTEQNFIDVRGNHNSNLFAPNFYSPYVWMTDDRLEISYSIEYGFRTEIVASITRTVDGYVLVGAHAKHDGKPQDSTYNDEVRTATTREALLRYAARVDALAAEFIIPQIREQIAA